MENKKEENKIEKVKKTKESTNKTTKSKVNKKTKDKVKADENVLIYKLLKKSTFVIFAILMLVILIMSVRKIRRTSSFYNKELLKKQSTIDINKYRINEKDVEKMKEYLEKK